MPVRKITVSIDDALLSEVETQAGAARQSRSEWLAEAARRTLDQAAVVRAMDQILADTGGPSSREEVTRARRKLGLPAATKRRAAR